MKTFMEFAQGNIGALSFITEVSVNQAYPVRTLLRLDESGMVGAPLYILWSDICGRDAKKVIHLVDNCPLDILKEACSKESSEGEGGKEMLEPYMLKEETK